MMSSTYFNQTKCVGVLFMFFPWFFPRQFSAKPTFSENLGPRICKASASPVPGGPVWVGSWAKLSPFSSHLWLLNAAGNGTSLENDGTYGKHMGKPPNQMDFSRKSCFKMESCSFPSLIAGGYGVFFHTLGSSDKTIWKTHGFRRKMYLANNYPTSHL